MNAGKQLSLILLATFACLAMNLRAAISVGPAGSPTLTFDTWPAAADISYRTLPGSVSSFTDAFSLEAGVQTNTAAMITNRLLSHPGNPPPNSTRPYWSSTGQYIQTRPESGFAGILVMATFRNDTGAEIASTMNLSYTLNIFATTVAADLGHMVYYSLSGVENSWVLIPDVSDQPYDNTAGTYVRSAIIDFSFMPWATGTNLYLLWADDDGSGSPDTGRQIDDLALTFPDEPVTITRHPESATLAECGMAAFSVEVEQIRALTYRWFQNGVEMDTLANPSAGTARLVITNARPANAGTYFVRVSNRTGRFADSDSAMLAVLVDDQGPELVYALESNGVVTISYSEPVDEAAAHAFGYAICSSVDLGDCVLVDSATLSPDFTTATLSPETRLRPGIGYEVWVYDVADRCKGNPIALDAHIPLSRQFPILLGDDVTLWRYNHDGVDLGTAWRQPLYNDGSWSNGYAPLGVEHTPLPDPRVRTPLVLTNANFPYAGAGIPTYYFRTHFNFPGNPAAPSARLKIRTAFDDYAYVYINGVEVYRDPGLGAVGEAELPFTAYSGGFDAAAWGPYRYISLASTLSGDNVLAVQLKQSAGFSFDIHMALELMAELAEAVPPPSLCAFRHSASDGSQQLRILWPCPDPALITGYVLQSADDLAGSWTTVTGARSPYVIATSAAKKFYRLYHE